MNVCLNCGSVHGYYYVNEYVDFHENMHKIRRKSVYHRKYHLHNKIDFLSRKNGVQISFKDKDRIIRVFEEIDGILPKINGDRNRMVNINFILRQLLMMLNLSVEKNISLSKSKKTLTYYEQYWAKVQLLIGDRIQSIINK